MKKSKKKLKGMTLIEMIISIFIFALMGGVLVLVGTSIDKQTKASNRLRDKIVEESPYAANHIDEVYDSDGNKYNLSSEEIDIVVWQDTYSNNYRKYEWVDPSDHSKGKKENTYPINSSNSKVEMKADKYHTQDVLVNGKSATKSAAQKQEIQNGVNSGLDLEFFDIQPLPASP